MKGAKAHCEWKKSSCSFQPGSTVESNISNVIRESYLVRNNLSKKFKDILFGPYKAHTLYWNPRITTHMTFPQGFVFDIHLVCKYMATRFMYQFQRVTTANIKTKSLLRFFSPKHVWLLSFVWEKGWNGDYFDLWVIWCVHLPFYDCLLFCMLFWNILCILCVFIIQFTSVWLFHHFWFQMCST